MRVRPTPRSFAAGELAPWLDGIATEATGRGARTLENWIVIKAGGVTRRPGTVYVQDAVGGSTAASRLIPFTASNGTSYVLEFYTNTIRVFKQSTHAQVVASVTTTYANADLSELRHLQVKDVLYIVHEDYEPRKLTWTDDTTWTLSVGVFKEEQQFIIPTQGAYYISNDGLTWTKHFAQFPVMTAYAQTARWLDGNWYLGIDSGHASKSIDGGKLWVSLPITTAMNSHTIYAFASDGEGVLVAVGNVGETARSADAGDTWVATASGASTAFRAVICEAGLFVAVGQTAICYTSPDGTTWTSRTSQFTADHIYAVAWETSLTLFVAVGAGGKISTSPDGITWTARTSGTAEDLYGVAWTGKMFLACGGSVGGAAILLGSEDGITWVDRTATITAVSTIFGDVITNDAQGIVVVAETATTVHVSTDYGYTFDTSVTLTGNFNQGGYGNARAFQIANERPSAIAFHGDRLILGSTLNEPSTVWGSVVGDYENFTQSYLANYAWKYTLADRGNVDIRWLDTAGGAIAVGARSRLGGMAGSSEVGITPSSVHFEWMYPHGSKDVQGLGIGKRAIFAQRGGKVIRQFPDGADLTMIADHIAEGGVTEIHYQDDPVSAIWMVRADGQLLSLTIANGMNAWARHRVGGSFGTGDAVVETMAIVPNATSLEDEIWVVVKRTVGGSTVRHVEYLDQIDFGDAADAHFVDAGVESANSVTMSTMGSLTHLAGEQVDVLIDGTQWLTAISVAASGTIVFTEGYSGTQCHAGLPINARLQTMRADYGSPWGSGAGLNARASTLWIWTYETLGLKAGPAEDDLTPEIVASGSAADLSTDVHEVAYPGQWDRDGYIWLVASTPLPATIVGIAPDVEVGDH